MKENILITGAGSGIGRASARRMAKDMHVIVADWNEDGAAETVSPDRGRRRHRDGDPGRRQ